MNPGVTSPSPSASTRVLGPTSFAISALSPTAETVSPETATAPAQGRAESPVQTRPYATRSAGPEDAGPERQEARPASASGASRRSAAARGMGTLSGVG